MPRLRQGARKRWEAEPTLHPSPPRDPLSAFLDPVLGPLKEKGGTEAAAWVFMTTGSLTFMPPSGSLR
jgi:hypothetical protein